MQRDVRALRSLERRGGNAGWKHCEQIRMGSIKFMNGVKDWSFKNGEDWNEI